MGAGKPSERTPCHQELELRQLIGSHADGWVSADGRGQRRLVLLSHGRVRDIAGLRTDADRSQLPAAK